MTIEELKEEVKLYSARIDDISRSDLEIDNLYKGTQIFFSPIKRNSPILFIGINPGAGFYNANGQKVKKIEPLDKSEYETEEYQLQSEWKYVFGEKEKINNLRLLYDGIKINCSFFATTDSNSLNTLKTKLKKYFGEELELKEKEWLSFLVDYINPKIIICEGIEAFNKTKLIFSKDDFNLTEDWKYVHKLAWCKNKIIVGFNRVYSRFSNIEDVVDTLFDCFRDLEIT